MCLLRDIAQAYTAWATKSSSSTRLHHEIVAVQCIELIFCFVIDSSCMILTSGLGGLAPTEAGASVIFISSGVTALLFEGFHFTSDIAFLF